MSCRVRVYQLVTSGCVQFLIAGSDQRPDYFVSFQSPQGAKPEEVVKTLRETATSIENIAAWCRRPV